jgi:hypothetical protein
LRRTFNVGGGDEMTWCAHIDIKTDSMREDGGCSVFVFFSKKEKKNGKKKNEARKISQNVLHRILNLWGAKAVSSIVILQDNG